MGRGSGGSFLAKFFFLLLVIAMGAGGVAYFYHDQRDRLREQLELQRKQLEKARKHIVNLLGERHVAEFRLLEKTPTQDGSATLRVLFEEFTAGGERLKPRILTIKGEEIYFDAIIIMFQPGQVMEGEAKSLHLFRRVFTEKVEPERGIVLWKEGEEGIPEIYRSPELPLDVQQRFWKEIVMIITDEGFRNEKGVRTVFGQANSVKAELGKTYSLSLQNNGGLVLEEKKEKPAEPKPPAEGSQE